MAITFSLVGKDESLKRLLNYSATGNLVLRLFSNNKTPTAADVVGDYTECTGSGYSAITLTGASWTIGTVDGHEEADYAEQTFTITGALTVYGAYLTNTAGTVLIGAERFSDAPHVFSTGGGTEKVTTKIIQD